MVPRTSKYLISAIAIFFIVGSALVLLQPKPTILISESDPDTSLPSSAPQPYDTPDSSTPGIVYSPDGSLSPKPYSDPTPDSAASPSYTPTLSPNDGPKPYWDPTPDSSAPGSSSPDSHSPSTSPWSPSYEPRPYWSPDPRPNSYAPDSQAPDSYTPNSESPNSYSPDAVSSPVWSPNYGPKPYEDPAPDSAAPSYTPTWSPSYGPKPYTDPTPDATSPSDTPTWSPSYGPKPYWYPTPDSLQPSSDVPNSYSPNSQSPDSYVPDSGSPNSYSPDGSSPSSWSPSYVPKPYWSPDPTPDSASPSYTPTWSPSYGPKPYWDPTPESSAPGSYYPPSGSNAPSWTPGGNTQVSIQYIGYGSECDRNNAEVVTVNRTQNCQPGCNNFGGQWVMTDCNNDVYLPRGFTWIEYIDYGYIYSACQYNAHSATYQKSGRCTGSFDFSLKKCDSKTVYVYSCNNPYCNQCQLNFTQDTNTCVNGSKYQCVVDATGKALANPLM